MFEGTTEHVARAFDHMLDGLSATAVQLTQVKQIAVAAATDVKSLREAGRDLREKGTLVLTASTVDEAAAEGIGQQLSAQHDQVSRRMLRAMLDIATVLTPEQRAKIGEHLKARQAVMQDRMRRMQDERSQSGPRCGPVQ